jgi:hypothetical protein
MRRGRGEDELILFKGVDLGKERYEEGTFRLCIMGV